MLVRKKFLRPFFICPENIFNSGKKFEQGIILKKNKQHSEILVKNIVCILSRKELKRWPE
jgi:hypothetical protein